MSLSTFLKSAVQRVEVAAKTVARDVATKVVEEVVTHAPELERDAFIIGNELVRKISSRPNQSLADQELALAKLVHDPNSTTGERVSARAELRRLMGAEPIDKLDPLPPEASAQAEQARSAEATEWDPAKDPATTPAQWVTSDKAGTHRSDPVNLYVHGDLADIVRGFQAGGWSIALPNTPESAAITKKNMARFEAEWAESKLPFLNHPNVSQDAYHAVNRMPNSTLYLDGQPELVDMEANNHPLTGRDHFRIYWTGKKDAEGKNIYAIAASRDEGLKLQLDRPAFGYMNHYTEKNADHERDFLLHTLEAGGAQVQVGSVTRDFGKPSPSGLHSEDGKVYDLVIGKSAPGIR